MICKLILLIISSQAMAELYTKGRASLSYGKAKTPLGKNSWCYRKIKEKKCKICVNA